MPHARMPHARMPTQLPQPLPGSLVIGWQEWVALPGLGLPAIKAKIDTGARTSALHAFLIEPFGPADAPSVRFGVRPIPGRDEPAVYCTAPLVGRRDVTSSNGETETRVFIRAMIEIGPRAWEIEIGLTNRDGMAYRMLLGRQALRDGVMVDAGASFLQPRLSFRLYRRPARTRSGAGMASRESREQAGPPAHQPAPAIPPLRLALVTRTPGSPSSRLLAAASRGRGHHLDCLDPSTLELSFAGVEPLVLRDREALAPYDAVAALVGRKDAATGAAVVRQLELGGAVAITSGDALARAGQSFAVAQTLAQAGIASELVTATVKSGIEDSARNRRLRSMLVVGGRVVAVVKQRPTRDGGFTETDGHVDAGGEALTTERELAERSAAALGLGIARVDIVVGEPRAGGSGRARIVAISGRAALARFERLTAVDVAGAIIRCIESRIRAAAARQQAIDA